MRKKDFANVMKMDTKKKANMIWKKMGSPIKQDNSLDEFKIQENDGAGAIRRATLVTSLHTEQGHVIQLEREQLGFGLNHSQSEESEEPVDINAYS